MSDRAWVLKYQLECDKVQWLQHIVSQREFLWANHYTKIFCFCVHSGALDLIYPETSLKEQRGIQILKKNQTYTSTFPVQRKEINAFVKVRFTMTYSSRKLNNKVITTACNFWRQIACSFYVYGRTNHHTFCPKSTWKNTVLNFLLFFTWPTLTSQAVFTDNFSDRSTKIRAKK